MTPIEHIQKIAAFKGPGNISSLSKSYILPFGVYNKTRFKKQQEESSPADPLSLQGIRRFLANRKKKQNPIGARFSMTNQTSPYIAVQGKTELDVWVSWRAAAAVCHLGRRALLGPCLSLCLLALLVFVPATAHVMHSLNQEIKAFSRNNLRKQCTRVTTLTGKKIIETWKDARIHVVEELEPRSGGGCGYVQDLSLDLQVGVIKPWLLLGSQDAAHDLDTLKKHKVTHILNVAYGVENAFLSDFTYKSISILDLPETNILSYFPECFEFIEQAKMKNGVVLVHCNAGVSRAAAIVIGFLMNSEETSFTSAFSLVKNARPSICPNSGFMEQLRIYQEGKESNKCDETPELERDDSL